MQNKRINIKIGHIDEQAVKPVQNYADLLLRFRWFEHLIKPVDSGKEKVVKFEEFINCPYCGSKLVLESKQEEAILIDNEDIGLGNTIANKKSLLFRFLIFKLISPILSVIIVSSFPGIFIFNKILSSGNFFFSFFVITLYFLLIISVVRWLYIEVIKFKLQKGIILRHFNPNSKKYYQLNKDNGMRLISSVKIKKHFNDRKHFLIGEKSMDALSWPDKSSLNATEIYSKYSIWNSMNFSFWFCV